MHVIYRNFFYFSNLNNNSRIFYCKSITNDFFLKMTTEINFFFLQKHSIYLLDSYLVKTCRFYRI